MSLSIHYSHPVRVFDPLERRNPVVAVPPSTSPVVFQLPEKKTTAWDYLAVSGNAILLLNDVVLLFSPLIRKNAAPILRALNRSVLKPFKLSSQRLQSMEQFLSDHKRLQDALKRGGLIGIGLQGINTYQTAINSRQPSIALQALLSSGLLVLTFMFPTKLMYSFGSLATILYNAGKRNDIDNNNHPERRREWDLQKLIDAFSAKFFASKRNTQSNPLSLKTEMKNASRFIADDLRHAFSPKAWQELNAARQNKKSWHTPQPFMHSISCQLGLVSWFTNAVGIFSKMPGLSAVASLISMASSILNNIPIYQRGLQNRHDIDGKLVLWGVPLALAGTFFGPQFTEKYFYLNGLAGIGVPLRTRGVTLNSKKYRAFLDELQLLHRQSRLHPELTAGDVLKHFKQNPYHWKQLEKQMGQSRVFVFADLLRCAETARKGQGISFHRFLTPLIASHND